MKVTENLLETCGHGGAAGLEQPRGDLWIHAGTETPKVSYSSGELGGWVLPLDFGELLGGLVSAEG